MSLPKRIETIVEDALANYTPQKLRTDKIIHDPILGTQRFYMHEVHIIDCPLVQRLKRIHQLGPAYQVYPSATHSRFEHSLGACTAATRMFRELELPGAMRPEYDYLDEKTLRTLRIAALLHDIGQGPFSHTSEIFMDQCDEIRQLKATRQFEGRNAHEIVSYLIVSSGPFQDLLHQVTKNYNTSFDAKAVADLIIGHVQDSNDQWMADILYDPFDADKVDYVKRDAHFTGLPISIDQERIFYSMLIEHNPETGRREIVYDGIGLPALEQMLFNKIFLYSTVYHQHKVRATAQMISMLLHSLEDRGSIESVADLVTLDDLDFITSKLKPEKKASSLMQDVRDRRLFKRAVVISENTIKSPLHSLQELEGLRNDTRNLDDLKNDIIQGIQGCNRFDVAIDIPPLPPLGEPSRTRIRMSPGMDGIKTIDKLFPVKKWLDSYATYKWRGHVFARGDHRRKVGKKSFGVLRDWFDLELSKEALTLAKYSEEEERNDP